MSEDIQHAGGQHAAGEANLPPAAPPEEYADPARAGAAPDTADELEIVSVEQLVGELRRNFDRDPRGCGAAALLGAYARACDDWRRFAFFDEECYTRNLIERNRAFELLVLCWDAGQASPIHNHEGQNCWAAVLEGPLQEVRYQVALPDGPGSGEPRPPVEGPIQTSQSGEVSFIRDEIALHVIRATPRVPAVSLHLYARPYDTCNVYCERTGRVTRKALTFHSVGGTLVRA